MKSNICNYIGLCKNTIRWNSDAKCRPQQKSIYLSLLCTGHTEASSQNHIKHAKNQLSLTFIYKLIW